MAVDYCSEVFVKGKSVGSHVGKPFWLEEVSSSHLNELKITTDTNNARTINEQGVTIVPLEVRILESGVVFIRAKDPAYATPGPDESQKFGIE